MHCGRRQCYFRYLTRVSHVSNRGVSKELQTQIYFWNKWRSTIHTHIHICSPSLALSLQHSEQHIEVNSTSTKNTKTTTTKHIKKENLNNFLVAVFRRFSFFALPMVKHCWCDYMTVCEGDATIKTLNWFQGEIYIEKMMISTLKEKNRISTNYPYLLHSYE